MTLSPNTPVIIGVGQSGDRIDAPDYRALSAADLAAIAAEAAIADAHARLDIKARIDAIATTRTFEDSRPEPAAFGKSSNFPRSIARRLGIDPRYALWTKGGGNSPQDLVTEFCERIAAGEFEVALIAGAEAISTVRHALSQGRTLDFAEEPRGQVEDRGPGYKDFADPRAQKHGVINAPLGYALAENARRGRLGLSREAYAKVMGELFAPFAAIAHDNPRAAWSVPAYSAEELVAIGAHNRWVCDPYPLHLVARDQVNLGAAILVTSLRQARTLGVPEDRLVYLHGYARAEEKTLIERPDLGVSPAARGVARAALDRADVRVDELAAFDFYSCFPIAVSNVACDEFGLLADDPRKLTVTGGLPFFGGPGNNYSMHAIAEMVDRLRQLPGRSGFIGANGGFLSKYSAGVYSTTPRDWRAFDSNALQARLDAVAAPPLASQYQGAGIIETYTVHHQKGEPRFAMVIGRSPEGARFIARTAEGDRATVDFVHVNDALGLKINATTAEGGVTTFERREEAKVAAAQIPH